MTGNKHHLLTSLDNKVHKLTQTQHDQGKGWVKCQVTLKWLMRQIGWEFLLVSNMNLNDTIIQVEQDTNTTLWDWGPCATNLQIL